MRNKSLQGVNIVVTRPKENATNLIDLLKHQGAKVLAFPTVAIEPIVSNIATCEKIKNLNQFDIVIFTSANAVRHINTQLKTYWPKMPTNTQFAAVGQATKMQLQQQGYSVKIIPPGQFSSEGLLETPALTECNHKKILIITGENTRSILATTLTKRGASVAMITTYRRIPIKQDPNKLLQQYEENKLDIFVTTSNDVLANLVAILGSNRETILKQVKFIVISQRNAAFAKTLGCQKVIVSEAASDDAIIKAIYHACDN